jgi:hypothetical protein
MDKHNLFHFYKGKEQVMQNLNVKQMMLFVMVLTLALAQVLLSGCAGTRLQTTPAQPPLPYGLERLANKADPYGLALWSERDPLIIGEKLQLYLRSMADSRLSLYGISSSGKTYKLMENMPASSGQTLMFPAEKSPVDFKLSPPLGVESYILISTLRPVNWLTPSDKLDTISVSSVNTLRMCVA